jgi:hypothetical protein
LLAQSFQKYFQTKFTDIPASLSTFSAYFPLTSNSEVNFSPFSGSKQRRQIFTTSAISIEFYFRDRVSSKCKQNVRFANPHRAKLFPLLFHRCRKYLPNERLFLINFS